MPKLASKPPSDEYAWRLAIGGLIWRMGQLEYLTFEWCQHLGGIALRDEAISTTGFGRRYELIVSAVKVTAWPQKKKKDALRLWRMAKCFSGFRNKVAHAPVVEIDGVSGILDARCLRGVGKRPTTVFLPEFIDSVSDKIQVLARRLDWTF
jgi:hypothetical protein